MFGVGKRTLLLSQQEVDETSQMTKQTAWQAEWNLCSICRVKHGVLYLS